MGIWDQSKDDNNGVKVYYTGKNLYHVNVKDGTYDGKIEYKPDGNLHVYGTSSGWADHSHKVYSSSGKIVYSRGEGYGHSWVTRNDD